MRRIAAAAALLALTATGVSAQTEPATWKPSGAQEILYSRYAVFDASGRIGTSHVTEFKRADRSRSVLVRERKENYGPVLDRFIVVTFDSAGQFHSGNWVATSEFSPRFMYRYYLNGHVVSGEWEDSNRGRGWVDVPANAGDPVFTFWGVPESLILTSFNAAGADLQRFDAVAVEDNLHTRMNVAVERMGREAVDVLAGRFPDATRFRVERFGDTHQWLDERGTLLRWVAEDGTTRWELEAYPSAMPHDDPRSTVARGTYAVSYVTGEAAGTLSWAIERGAEGALVLAAEEQFAGRTMRFRGTLDDSLRWSGSSYTVDWHTPDTGAPERQHFETFFHRGRFHLLRFRDRAYPYHQTRDVTDALPFHLIHVPVAAASWLRTVPRNGRIHQFDELAVLGNFYWGASADILPAEVRFMGVDPIDTSMGSVRANRFHLTYRGGWHDSHVTYWTDDRLIPLRVDVSGFLRYDLVDYTVNDRDVLPAVR